MTIKSSRYLPALKRTVSKSATPGERVMGKLFPNSSYATSWSNNRFEQVQHLLDWQFIAINIIASKVASISPNTAMVSDVHKPGRTVKACQRAMSGGMFGGSTEISTTYAKSVHSPVLSGRDMPMGFGGGHGHSFMTIGEYKSKALSVIKPHEELEPLENSHLLRRLIDNPNPMDTAFDYTYEKVMFLYLCGTSYEWIIPNAFGKPAERWVLPSHWVWPRTGDGRLMDENDPNANKLIAYFEVRPWGGTGSAGMLRIPANEVVMTRFKSPINKLDGYSRLWAISRWIDTEESITKSRWAQFINKARPELWIELGPGYEDPDDNIIARLESKIAQKHQGEMNTGKPLVTPSGAKATVLSFSPNEMDYFQCLDKDTECLTAEGWKNYTELSLTTRIACFDKDTGRITYQTPSNINIKPYAGKMYKWNGQRVDAMMSPNHRVYHKRLTSELVGGEVTKKLTPYRNSFRMSKVRPGAKTVPKWVWDIKQVEAIKPGGVFKILCGAPAACDAPTAIKLDSYGGHRQQVREAWDKWVEPKAWMRFLGYYISEGCCIVSDRKDGWKIDVTQKKYVEEFREALKPIANWNEYTSQNDCVHFTTSNKGLYAYLVKHCGERSITKKIPDCVKSWPAEYLIELFDALMLGDGTTKEFVRQSTGEETWHGTYPTISKQLADDVMELAIKCGYTAGIYMKDPGEWGNHPIYIVNISPHAVLDVTAEMRTEVDYEGDIWCVTVPTGLFVVRRNGKAHITGNSEEQMAGMILSAFGVPKAAAGLVNDMTFGSILATLMNLCEGCINPLLVMLGQTDTKQLASRWDEDDRKCKLWYDNTTPADPSQVNSDLTTDMQCILPGQKLKGVVIGASESNYSGDAFEILTESGVTLSVTKNHPILTMEGLVPACQLKEGDHLLRDVGKDEFLVAGYNEQHAPTVVEKVFEAFSILNKGWIEVSCAPVNFHGDAERFKGHIKVVGTYRKLLDGCVSDTAEHFTEGSFIGLGFSEVDLKGRSCLHLLSDGLLSTSTRLVGGCDHSSSFLISSGVPQLLPNDAQVGCDIWPVHSQLACIGTVSNFNAEVLESSAQPDVSDPKTVCNLADRFTSEVSVGYLDHVRSRFGVEPLCLGSVANLDAMFLEGGFQRMDADADFARQFSNRFTSNVALDKIVQIRKFHYSGLVYDFESPHGLIISNSLYISNCNALTPNEVRVMRGRKPYRLGGNNPLVQGPGGLMPLPINEEESMDDLGELVAQYTSQLAGEKDATKLATQQSNEDIPPDEVTPPAPEDEGEPSKVEELSEDMNDGGKIEEPNGKPSKKSLVRKSPDPYQVAAAINRAAWSRGRVASDGVKVLNEGQIQRIVDDYNNKTGSSEASVSGIKRGNNGSGSFGMGSGYGMTYEGGKFVITQMKSLTATKRHDPGTRVTYVGRDGSRLDQHGRIVSLMRSARTGQWTATVRWDEGGQTTEPLEDVQEVGGRGTVLRSNTFKKWCKRWTKQYAGHDYSSTQFNLEGEAQRRILQWTNSIEDDDLHQKGREDIPHVTVRYGLEGSDAGPVRQLVETFGSVSATLSEVDYFPSEQYDVLIVRVESEQLHTLNELLADLPHVDTHPTYQPHVTIAYLKPGMGQHYVDQLTGMTPDEQGIVGDQLQFTHLVFSPKEGTPTLIEIDSYAAQEAGKSWDSLEDGGRFPEGEHDGEGVVDKTPTRKQLRGGIKCSLPPVTKTGRTVTQVKYVPPPPPVKTEAEVYAETKSVIDDLIGGKS